MDSRTFQRLALYQAKAQEAEAKAAKASLDGVREAWLRIAQCYRQMAEEDPGRKPSR